MNEDLAELRFAALEAYREANRLRWEADRLVRKADELTRKGDEIAAISPQPTARIFSLHLDNRR